MSRSGSLKSHRRRRSSTVSFKSVNDQPGMECGETPSVADYFVIAGLDQANPLLITPPEYGEVAPVVDIAVILPNENELCPEGWEYVVQPGTYYPANFNWVNPAQLPVYIILRRGYDLKPCCDIDIFFAERKEKPRLGWTYIKTSISGKPVSLNGHVTRPTKHVYIGFRRSLISSFTEAVTHLFYTATKRDEKQGYRSIRLHRSTFTSDLFITFKITKFFATMGIFKETLIDSYPAKDNATYPLNRQHVPAFCLPMGVQIEWFRNKDSRPPPKYSSFVLTNDKGLKMYGSSLTFYELVIGTEEISRIMTDVPRAPDTFPYATKSICVLSRWACFFETFKKWLSELYELSVSGLAQTIPIERLISNMMYDVPFPTPAKPTVELGIGDSSVQFEQPLTTQIPTSGGTMITLVQCLDPNHVIDVFFQLLLEENVLLISDSSSKLTACAEAICSLLYPIKWVSTFIPLLPRSIGEQIFVDYELDLLTPFIIGMKRDILMMYSCPDRLTQVDLDNNRIRLPSSNVSLSDQLPKTTLNNLRNSLANVYNEVEANQLSSRRTELAVQEIFLRLQATLLAGYTEYLLPVMEHKDRNFVNAENLFDVDKFIASRGDYQRTFYKKLLRTQMFNCFIMARSFLSDSDETLEFFDGCIEKLGSSEPLLVANSDNRGVTVVVQSNKISKGISPGKLYSYPVFVLDPDLFYQSLPGEKTPLERSVITLCTKVEKQKMSKRCTTAKTRSATPAWARCLVQQVYSVWFLYLPSLIAVLEPGEEQRSQLTTALEIIKTIKSDRKTNLEEVCYRILISLSGFHEYPTIAMSTFQHMQESKVSISAVTYGHYHRAVLFNEDELKQAAAANRPSGWRLLRLYVNTCMVFRRVCSNKKSPVTIVNSSSLESIQSTRNGDSPVDPGGGGRGGIGMSDSGIELDTALSGLKTNSLDKKKRPCSSRPPVQPIRRGHTRSVSDVSMLSVRPGDHERQLSDDAGSKTLSRLRSPRLTRHSIIGRQVQDRRALTRVNTNSFRRLKAGITQSSSTYSVQSLDNEGEDPGEFYIRPFENPRPIKFTLTPNEWGVDDVDQGAELKVRMWSAYKCSNCDRTVYDEQILAGMSPEESNLSSTCPYCERSSVAHLTVEVTYVRNSSDNDNLPQNRPHRESSISKAIPVDISNIHISLEGEEEEEDLLATTSINSQSGNIAFAMPDQIRRERKNRSGSIIASMNPRPATKHGSTASDVRVETFEVPYLCPIVLRKEVECVCQNDGSTELAKDDLATSHSILFWNMVWWFSRENLPSSLPLYIPHAFRKLHPHKKLCQSVEISTLWCRTEDSLYNKFEELSRTSVNPPAPASHLKQWRIIESYMQDDISEAIRLLTAHRSSAQMNIYRELLSLGCCYKNAFSPLDFSEQYAVALSKLPTVQSTRIQADDVPPYTIRAALSSDVLIPRSIHMMNNNCVC